MLNDNTQAPDANSDALDVGSACENKSGLLVTVTQLGLILIALSVPS